MKKNLIILSLISLLFSCEEVVNIDLKPGVNQLVVDAWLIDNLDEQKIKLSLSQAYFDNTSPKPALGATVIVFNADSTQHVFEDKKKNGEYTYIPNKNKPLLKLNETTALYIKYQNEEFYALSVLKRVPKIDSMSYENFSFPIPDPNGGPQVGFLGEFYAKDFDGLGDTYMIRSTKNDTLRFKPSEIALAYDAGFSPGSKSDGLLFILPIRQSINQGLFRDKDKVKVELFSLPQEAFYFLQQLKQESSNGGIFATPLSNIPTNIINLNTASKNKAIGAFFVSKVSTFESVVDKAKAKAKR